MKKCWFLALLIALIFLPTGSHPVYTEEKNEILIGAPLPLTGDLAMIGRDQKWAYEQAVLDINRNGGIYIRKLGRKLPVKLVILDDQSIPGKAVTVTESLINEHQVDLMLSTHSAHLVIPQCIIAEKYKVYLHATASFPFLWLEHEFKWSTLFFMKADETSQVPFEIWNSLPESSRPRRPALLLEDTIDGYGFGKGFRSNARKYGYSIAADETFPVGTKDYSKQIEKMNSTGVDALLLFGSPVDNIALIKQMKNLGFYVKYLHGWKGTWSSELWNALKRDSDYIISDGFWSEDFHYPNAKDIGNRYFQTFKRHSVTVGLFYATARILWEAIERAGTIDSKKVREAVLSTHFKGTVMGDVKYDKSGLATFQSTANQWWNGKQEIVYPFVKGGWRLKMAPPWDKRDD